MSLTTNRSASPNVRAATLAQTAADLLSFAPGNTLLKAFTSMPDNPVKGWQAELKGRTITLSAPERGNDGAYLITISGSPLPLLRAGIDKYAYGYGFHRISEPEQTLQFTMEWKGDPPANDALKAAHFLTTIQQLSALPSW